MNRVAAKVRFAVLVLAVVWAAGLFGPCSTARAFESGASAAGAASGRGVFRSYDEFDAATTEDRAVWIAAEASNCGYDKSAQPSRAAMALDPSTWRRACAAGLEVWPKGASVAETPGFRGDLRQKIRADMEANGTTRQAAAGKVRRGEICFVAGTLVHTSDGKKPIEEIKVGDEVLSYNEVTGQTEYKPVLATFSHEAKEVLDVSIDGETEPLGVTPQHLFFVHRARDNTSNSDSDDDEGAGEWIAAGKLREGDSVRRPNGEWVRVVRIEKRETGATVYNFSVAENHTYFVGLLGTVVHNDCPEDFGPQSPRSPLGRDIAERYPDPSPTTYRNGLSPDTPVVDHVRARALGGHPTDPENLQVRAWSENSRKGWHEGNYLRERTRLVNGGLTRRQAEWVLEDYLRWIETDIHATPVDPAKLDKLISPR